MNINAKHFSRVKLNLLTLMHASICQTKEKILFYNRVCLSPSVRPFLASLRHFFTYLFEVQLSYDPVCPSVGRSVELSVCHNFLSVGAFIINRSFSTERHLFMQ